MKARQVEAKAVMATNFFQATGNIQGRADRPRIVLPCILSCVLPLIVLIVSSTACVGGLPYVWVDDLPQAALAPDAYRIQAQDSIGILVWNQAKLSIEAKVRTDGQITMPLIGDVAVLGLTPAGAAQQIERRLDGLVVDPKVTVSLKETMPVTYSVLGEVKNSGSYPLGEATGLLQALATAGGLTELADKGQIFVIRRDPEVRRIRFSYKKLQQAEGRGIMFQLRGGDIIVVEE